MAHWERVGVPPDFAGVTRADRVGGSYLRYHPDPLVPSVNVVSGEVLELAADVSTALARLGERLRANPLPILHSTMLRSESISSSWIEGIRETPRAIAVAQLDPEHSLGDGPPGRQASSPHAAAVVRNVASMQHAIARLGRGAWTHDDILAIHHDLLPWHRVGYRTSQVWIGGTHRLNADYAAPPYERVEALMDDLLDYANTSGDLPVIQAAIVHAQFETIHPFHDGNGRVGRALVHGLLHRAGLVAGGVISLSSVLREDVDGYVAALSAYRYDGHDRGPALSDYVGRFLGYVAAAVEEAERFRLAAIDVHARWTHAVASHRSDSSVHRALDVLVEHPVVSARLLADRLDISAVSAQKVVKHLVAAGVVRPSGGRYRRSALFQADDVLDLLEHGAARP